MRRRENPLAGLSMSFIQGCTLLLVGQSPSHGYDLMEGLGRIGFKSIDKGGFYRMLRSMEGDDLVRSTVGASELGPARRTYELTRKGEEWLHGWAAALQEMQWTARKCLRLYDGFFKTATERTDLREPSFTRGRVAGPPRAGSQALLGDVGSVAPIALLGKGWAPFNKPTDDEPEP